MPEVCAQGAAGDQPHRGCRAGTGGDAHYGGLPGRLQGRSVVLPWPGGTERPAPWRRFPSKGLSTGGKHMRLNATGVHVVACCAACLQSQWRRVRSLSPLLVQHWMKQVRRHSWRACSCSPWSGALGPRVMQPGARPSTTSSGRYTLDTGLTVLHTHHSQCASTGTQHPPACGSPPAQPCART